MPFWPPRNANGMGGASSCVFEILQPAKVLWTVWTLASGRKGWILAAVLFMCHPVFLFCELAPTGKLTGNIIQLGIMDLLVLCEPSLLPKYLVTPFMITRENSGIRIMFPVVEFQGVVIPKVLVTLSTMKRCLVHVLSPNVGP